MQQVRTNGEQLFDALASGLLFIIASVAICGGLIWLAL